MRQADCSGFCCSTSVVQHSPSPCIYEQATCTRKPFDLHTLNLTALRKQHAGSCFCFRHCSHEHCGARDVPATLRLLCGSQRRILVRTSSCCTIVMEMSRKYWSLFDCTTKTRHRFFSNYSYINMWKGYPCSGRSLGALYQDRYATSAKWNFAGHYG